MFRYVSMIGAIIAFAIISLDTYVFWLDDAGRGCFGWYDCDGKALFSSSPAIEGEALFRGTPSQLVGGWRGIAYRILAGVQAFVVLSLIPLAWRRQPQRVRTLGWVAVLLLLVVAQGLLGLRVVELKAMQQTITGYQALGFMTFWLLSWIVVRFQSGYVLRQTCGYSVKVAWLAMLALLLQVIWGVWVSVNHAGLACGDFPLCKDLWVPDADFAEVFNMLVWWGGDSSAKLGFGGQLAADWLHRLMSMLIILIVLPILLLKNSEQPKLFRGAQRFLVFLLLLQFVLGTANVILLQPLWSVMAHSVTAALLMLPLQAIYFYGRYSLESTTPDSVGVVVSKQTTVDVSSEPESLFFRLRTQLGKTRLNLEGVLSSLSSGQRNLRDVLEDVEASLLMADVGIETTTEILRRLSERMESGQLKDVDLLTQTLKENLFEILQPCSQPLHIPKRGEPFVILVVGVNGVGKTTSIGKLAQRLKSQGHSVMLAAGDTFRAAAVEQLQTWGERNGVQVVAQHTGADSASVIYDALQSAKAKGVDVLIADTAGRLHTKSNLMEELKKIKRIMGKLDESAPHEVLLILDAGTGQNALSQARLFHEAVQLTGIAITKLDGTAKGGIIFALANQLRLPIRFVGVGESIEDLQDFDARNFVDALFVSD